MEPRADYAAEVSVAATSEYGTPRANGTRLLELALNMKSPTIYDTVWRGMSSGNTLLAHVVGAGKTFTMAAIAESQLHDYASRLGQTFAHETPTSAAVR